MRFVLSGDSDCPIARIALGYGESVKMESGSMVYSRDVEISGGLNSKKKGLGGVLGAIGRSITSGESMFITTATGTGDKGEIAIAPPIPGKIVELVVNDVEVDINPLGIIDYVRRAYRLVKRSARAVDLSLLDKVKRQCVVVSLFLYAIYDGSALNRLMYNIGSVGNNHNRRIEAEHRCGY